MTNLSIRNLIIVFIIVSVGVACSDSSTSPDSSPATVEGRADNTDSSSEKVQTKSVDGAVVTAARVTSSGNVETIGDAEAETNAEGEFTLEIDGDAAANAGNNIVIVAESNGEKAEAFVTAQLKSGNTVEVQPITLESTAEADVYKEVVANGHAEVVSKADIEATVNGKVAQDINSNAENAADIAVALKERTEAKAKFYSEQGIEITEEQLNNTRETKTQALLELESRLNATTDTGEAEAAFNSFLETVANAETEADVEATAAVKASESSSHILVNQSTDISAEAQAEIRKHAAYMTTFALEKAVEAQMQAAAATESSVNSAVDAVVDLRAEIKAMSNASEEEVKAVFEAFNDEIESIVQSDAEINGDLFVSANSTINEDNGAKASLESSLSATLKLSLIVDAYTDFYSEVHSIVDSTFTAASETEAEAYAQLLILINIAS